MNNFSISDMSRYSGILPHTIRIWEQRYNTLKPKRSDGNTRYYDGNQLRRLLNIVSLMEDGYKISWLSALKDADIQNMVYEKESIHVEAPFKHFILQLISAGLNYDEFAFEKIFSSCIARFDFQETYVHIICPLLQQLGTMWSCEKALPPQEHFLSNLLRQKIFSAINELPPGTKMNNTWLLFLPEDEYHDIGLLYAHYLLRHAGEKVIYLGASMQAETIMEVLKSVKVKNLLMFRVHDDLPELPAKILGEIAKLYPKLKLYMAGNADCTANKMNSKKITYLQNPAELALQLGI
ncbi:MAG: MerR family transcriptional regulator [Chitinophagaceae bacterium]